MDRAYVKAGTLFSVAFLEKNIQDIQDTQYQEMDGLFIPTKYFFTEVRCLEKKVTLKKLSKNLLCL